MSKNIDFLTSVGRLVQGDCFEPQTKKMDGSPMLDKQGQPTQKYFVAVAFKKTDAVFLAIKAQMDACARQAFPQLFPVPGGACVNPQFSWKIIDGDGIDQNGKPNNTKEGFAGCWILRASSTYPPKCFAAGKYAPHEQLAVKDALGNALQNPIPRGHFVRIAGSFSDNNGSNTVNTKPGLYVNLNMIEWASIGDVIVSGPDAAVVFGGAAAAPAPMPPQAAPPAPAAPPVPVAVAPHTGILAGPQMTPAAGATTYAQYVAAGWTDANLIAHGFMVAPAAIAPLPPVGSAPPPPAPAPVAPAPVGKVMLPPAGATTYAQYLAAGWSDAQLVQNGFMAA